MASEVVNLNDTKYGYASGLYNNYLPDHYYVGKYNYECYSCLWAWVNSNSQGDVLLLEGKKGMGKVHLITAIFKSLGLEENVKMMSSELVVDLIIKKRISLRGGNGCYSEDLFEKTFEPMKYIVIRDFDYLARWLRQCGEEDNWGPKDLFIGIVNKWIEAGTSIILTCNEHIDYWESLGIEGTILEKIETGERICIEMPISQEDKVGIIDKSILKWEFDKELEKQFKKSIKEIWEKAGIETPMGKDAPEEYSVISEKERVLSSLEMQEVIGNDYNSILEMCADVVGKIKNKK